MSEPTFLVTLDSVGFDRKPKGGEIGAITRRMQAAGPAEVTADELARVIVGGVTWCGGCFEPCADKWGTFVSMQFFGIDIDNDCVMLGEDGKPVLDEAGHKVKRPLMPDESGYLDPWEALNRFNRTFHCDPLMMYQSFNFSSDGTLEGRWNPNTRMKYRIVFDAAEPIADKNKAQAILSKLLEVFPEGDTSCRNVNRMLFGTRGKLVLFGEDGARYYHGS